VRLLDCTLRDGGHINNGLFGERAIRLVIKRLVEARVDIIEAGFLWGSPCGPDAARYFRVGDLKPLLPKDMGSSKLSLMADFIDVGGIEPCDGTVEYIRLSFKRHRQEWALGAAESLMAKGYKCFINPVNCNVYSDTEYLRLIERANRLGAYAFSIVDTFGVMRKGDLTHRYFLVEKNLRKEAAIGLHLHENLGLAFSLAQHFAEIASPGRGAVIDGSLLGMGRVPGNLCVEQMMDHLNSHFGAGYATEPAFDAIDDFIAPIKAESPWGYSIPYALSAKYGLHRTYAEYLADKKRLKTKDIQRILRLVGKPKSEMFDEPYIESLYKAYMNVVIDSSAAIDQLGSELEPLGEALVISPGASVIGAERELADFAKSGRAKVFSVNFLPGFIEPDYVFCTSARRMDMLGLEAGGQGAARLVVTSNVPDPSSRGLVISYNDLAYFDEEFCDDSTLMLLGLLRKAGVRRVSLAGFDGYAEGGSLRYADPLLEKAHKGANSNSLVNAILKKSFQDVELRFLTKSAHDVN
jgi:4-hydroxy 2-oxovalerate aldolase